jgi:hypothetical protein
MYMAVKHLETWENNSNNFFERPIYWLANMSCQHKNINISIDILNRNMLSDLVQSRNILHVYFLIKDILKTEKDDQSIISNTQKSKNRCMSPVVEE